MRADFSSFFLLFLVFFMMRTIKNLEKTMKNTGFSMLFAVLPFYAPNASSTRFLPQPNPISPQIGPNLAPFRPSLAQSGPTWPQLGPNMAPTWPQLGSNLAQLGPNLELDVQLELLIQHSAGCAHMPCFLDLQCVFSLR